MARTRHGRSGSLRRCRFSGHLAIILRENGRLPRPPDGRPGHPAPAPARPDHFVPPASLRACHAATPPGSVPHRARRGPRARRRRLGPAPRPPHRARRRRGANQRHHRHVRPTGRRLARPDDRCLDDSPNCARRAWRLRLARSRHAPFSPGRAPYPEHRVHRERERRVPGDGREPAGGTVQLFLPGARPPGARGLAGRAEQPAPVPHARRAVRLRVRHGSRCGGAREGGVPGFWEDLLRAGRDPPNGGRDPRPGRQRPLGIPRGRRLGA